MVDGLTHFASVRVAVTDVAVIRTYFTEFSLELVRAGTGELGSPPLPGAGATILAGIWPAHRNRSGTIWTLVRVSTGTVVIGRTLGDETFAPVTWVFLALVLHILTSVSRERDRAAAREVFPIDKAVTTMFTGVGLARIVLRVVPVRILWVGSSSIDVLFLVVILITILVVVRGPIWVWVYE